MENLEEDTMLMTIGSEQISVQEVPPSQSEDGEGIDLMVEVTEEDPMIANVVATEDPSNMIVLQESVPVSLEVDSYTPNEVVSDHPEDSEDDAASASSPSQSPRPQTTSKTTSDPSHLIPFSFPGQTFDIKCQKLILNVWDFFKRLKRNPDILSEIKSPQERAAAALHISTATIGKIAKNLKRCGKLETPGKRRNRAKPVVDSVSESDQQVIRSIIEDLRNRKINPTLPMVIAQAREKINFKGGSTSFRRILQRMGYKSLSIKQEPPLSSNNHSVGIGSSGRFLKKGKMGKKFNRGDSRNADTDTDSHSSNSRMEFKKNIIYMDTSMADAGNTGEDSGLHSSHNAILLPQSQTVHILTDNTIQPVQVLYTTTIQQLKQD